VQEKFEEIFSKFGSTKDGQEGLYWKDMWAMIKHYRNVFDPTGWTAMFLEWGALWLIAADDEVCIRCRLSRLPLPALLHPLPTNGLNPTGSIAMFLQCVLSG